MKFSCFKGGVFKMKIKQEKQWIDGKLINYYQLAGGAIVVGAPFFLTKIPSVNFRWKYRKRGIRRGKDKREESIIRGADLLRNHFLKFSFS